MYDSMSLEQERGSFTGVVHGIEPVQKLGLAVLHTFTSIKVFFFLNGRASDP